MVCIWYTLYPIYMTLISALAIRSILKCQLKLLPYSQTSMVAPLNFGKGWVISSPILLDVWLFFHAIYGRLCVFSLQISLMMIARICVLYFITIIKSDTWPICHCLGLGHETMVCHVYTLLIKRVNNVLDIKYPIFIWHPSLKRNLYLDGCKTQRFSYVAIVWLCFILCIQSM